MKKVLIHALGAEMGGAMRHLSNFLPELGKQDLINSYVVLTKKSFPKMELPDNIRIDRSLNFDGGSWLRRLYLDNILVSRRIRRQQFDLFITLTNFGPIRVPCPHILFQRNSLYFCNYYLNRIKGKLKAEIFLRRRLAVAAIMHADLIITPSYAMADMIRETSSKTGCKEFRTLYHGFSEENLKLQSLDERFIDMLNRRGVKLLYPTHAAPHKGFEILFEALACVKDVAPGFVFFMTICNDDWPEGIRKYNDMVESLGLSEHVVFMGRVPQDQMGAVYQACDWMVYPSLCESFGFSMVEAISLGLPVVAADTPVNREICEDAALYYPSTDAKALADLLKGIINGRPRETDHSANGGSKMGLRGWNWEKYVRAFLEICAMT